MFEKRGEILLDLRESLGQTQAEFGPSIGIAQNTVSMHEKYNRDIAEDSYRKILELHGVNLLFVLAYSHEGKKVMYFDNPELFPESAKDILRERGYTFLYRVPNDELNVTGDADNASYITLEESLPPIANAAESDHPYDQEEQSSKRKSRKK